MKKIKMYKYIGQNGIITTSVLLNGVPHLELMYLIADNKKILTNGEVQIKSIVTELDNVDQWQEIDYLGQD